MSQPRRRPRVFPPRHAWGVLRVWDENLAEICRLTFFAKNAIEYDLPLPCVCQNILSLPRLPPLKIEMRFFRPPLEIYIEISFWIC